MIYGIGYKLGNKIKSVDLTKLGYEENDINSTKKIVDITLDYPNEDILKDNLLKLDAVDSDDKHFFDMPNIELIYIKKNNNQINTINGMEEIFYKKDKDYFDSKKINNLIKEELKSPNFVRRLFKYLCSCNDVQSSFINEVRKIVTLDNYQDGIKYFMDNFITSNQFTVLLRRLSSKNPTTEKELETIYNRIYIKAKNDIFVLSDYIHLLNIRTLENNDDISKKIKETALLRTCIPLFNLATQMNNLDTDQYDADLIISNFEEQLELFMIFLENSMNEERTFYIGRMLANYKKDLETKKSNLQNNNQIETAYLRYKDEEDEIDEYLTVEDFVNSNNNLDTDEIIQENSFKRIH